MKAKTIKRLVIAGSIVFLMAIAFIIYAKLFNINTYKLKIQTLVSRAIGLDFRINGKIELSFFPFCVSIDNIHASAQGNDIFKISKTRLWVSFFPLLKKQFNVTRCELFEPSVTIIRDAEGTYNFRRPREALPWKGDENLLTLHEIKVSNGSFIYQNKKKNNKTECKEINLTIRNFILIGLDQDEIKNISFTGDIECGEIRHGNFIIQNLKTAYKADKGLFLFRQMTMGVFNAKGEGGLAIDLSAIEPVGSINLKISNLDFAKLIESFSIKKTISGKGELSASLSIKAVEGHLLMNKLEGTFALRGEHLTTNTIDLDKVLSSYKSSQQINLVDLGAYIIAGPFSIIALKGYRYGDVYYQTLSGQGTITRFNSHWKIIKGVAQAIDCALATQHNRVALKGSLDFTTERYDNVTIALLDEKGCALFKQTIQGPFSNPRIGTISSVESLAGPLANVYRKIKGLVQGGKCEAFYNGSVLQPL